MKRFGYLYEKIISIENLELADLKARKGKSRQLCIKRHDKNRRENIIELNQVLERRAYKTSHYHTFKIFEPKERIIFSLPYFPDRIVHHAILNVIEPIFVSTFTADTYSCIKGRGIHSAASKLKTAVIKREETKYCLKIDIRKFYPSIDHDVLKSLLRKKFKDKDLLRLIDEIIDSSDGVPIGNYLSQFLANFYLTYFDHWVKEQKKVKHYFRYADDMVFFSRDKPSLHKLLFEIRIYLEQKLKLTLKNNYQIFPTEIRGVDVLGYVFFPDYTRVRKKIKQNLARRIKKNFCNQSIASSLGWLDHANCVNLRNKLVYGKS